MTSTRRAYGGVALALLLVMLFVPTHELGDTAVYGHAYAWGESSSRCNAGGIGGSSVGPVWFVDAWEVAQQSVFGLAALFALATTFRARWMIVVVVLLAMLVLLSVQRAVSGDGIMMPGALVLPACVVVGVVIVLLNLECSQLRKVTPSDTERYDAGNEHSTPSAVGRSAGCRRKSKRSSFARARLWNAAPDAGHASRDEWHMLGEGKLRRPKDRGPTLATYPFRRVRCRRVGFLALERPGRLQHLRKLGTRDQYRARTAGTCSLRRNESRGFVESCGQRTPRSVARPDARHAAGCIAVSLRTERGRLHPKRAGIRHHRQTRVHPEVSWTAPTEGAKAWGLYGCSARGSARRARYVRSGRGARRGCVRRLVRTHGPKEVRDARSVSTVGVSQRSVPRR